MKTTRTLTAIALALPATLLLGGCSVIDEYLYDEVAHKFESPTELDQSWGKTAPWLPDDATEIRTREKGDGLEAILLANSTSQLDPAQCSAPVARQSAPVFDTQWSPDPYVEKVQICGDWAVIATESGWFGWTPIDPDEKALAG